jgi:hypothetical protein
MAIYDKASYKKNNPKYKSAVIKPQFGVIRGVIDDVITIKISIYNVKYKAGRKDE